jgi:two-component system CheB/CheR fusion protein
MDLVSCRNLLIYLQPEVQRRLLQDFHFALDADRCLFLGRAETVGTESAHFALASQRARVYRRVGGPRLRADLAPAPRRRRDPAFDRTDAVGPASRPPDHSARIAQTLRETGSTAGIPTLPLSEGTVGEPSAALRLLEEELRRTQRELRGAVEDLEIANEELKVANEEAMSMNEELQSTNEELETSKEELQSVNEELTTVNAQLQEKVREIEGTNNDLGNLLSSTDTPTLFLDRELRIKRFVPTAAQLFSLRASDLSRPLSDIASRIDMAALRRDAERVLADLQPRQEETRSDDGRCHLRRTQPYRTGDGTVEGVVVTFTDISELKAATEELRRLAAVVKNSADAIIVHDPQGRVIAWNRGAQQLYGYSESEALQQSIDTLLVPGERDVYEVQVRAALEGEQVQAITMQRRARDGRVIKVSTTLTPLPSDEGRAPALALIERDITSRMQIEADLRASERRFHALADSAPVLIWLADAQGRLVFTNQECSLVTGQEPRRLLGRLWTELLHPDDVPGALAAGLRAQRDLPGGRIETTARLLGRDHTSRWVKLVVLPRGGSGDDAEGLVGCMFDIEAQVAAEGVLHQESERKDEFLAMLGHELRNPLVPIRNAAEVLNHVGSSDPRIAWVRDTLVRQVDHVTRLVDDLLDISRVTRGAMSLHLAPVELTPVVQRAVDAVRPLFERKRHRFGIQLPDVPVWIEGDAIRLAQVVENLLTNAAKYTDSGGEIALRRGVEANRAVLHVRDNGIGIAPHMQGRMFDLFVQDERAIDRSQGGLGIGLALVRHLVELHGGSVVAESPGSGEGSDFVVTLPLLDAAASALPTPRAAGSKAAGGRVMLFDDDADACESLAMLLSLYGFEVETASDVDAGLRTAASFVPQVVVLDLAMPGADGYEVARRLAAMPALAKTRYIALSGFGAAADVARSAQAGFAHHFVKPADPEQVRGRLAELLAAQDATG